MAEESKVDVSNLPYRELLGSLMYLMLATRPHLFFPVHYFATFQNNFRYMFTLESFKEWYAIP